MADYIKVTGTISRDEGDGTIRFAPLQSDDNTPELILLNHFPPERERLEAQGKSDEEIEAIMENYLENKRLLEREDAEEITFVIEGFMMDNDRKNETASATIYLNNTSTQVRRQGVDLIAKKNCGRHFSSVPAFFEATHNEERLELLIERLKEATGNEDPRQEEAWRSSLPDFAEMLSSPVEYLMRTKERLEEHMDCLEIYCDWLDGVDISAGEINDAGAIQQIGGILHKEVFGDEIYGLGEEPRSICDEKKEAIRERCDDIEAAIEEMRENNIVVPVDLAVEIEYQFPIVQQGGGFYYNAYRKSADVILHSKSNNRYMIVELKQWTEDQIDIRDKMVRISGSESYTEDHPLLQAAVYSTVLRDPDWNCSMTKIKSFPECESIDRNSDRCTECSGSAENVRALYPDCEEDWWAGEQWILSKFNIEEAPYDPMVVPLIYLHKQYIDDSVLDRDRPPHIANLYESRNGRDAIVRQMKTMFARSHCEEAIRTIIDYFTE